MSTLNSEGTDISRPMKAATLIGKPQPALKMDDDRPRASQGISSNVLAREQQAHEAHNLRTDKPLPSSIFDVKA